LAEKRASDPSGLLASISARRQGFLDEILPAGADGQVISVCRRFSLIAVAGEMATNLGILPWQENEAFNAASAGFTAWLKERGGIGASEDRQAVRTVRRFLEQHEESRFRLLVPNTNRQAGDDEIRDGKDVINRVGFRRETPDGWEFLIFPESWKQDVCKGLDPSRSAAALDRAGSSIRAMGTIGRRNTVFPASVSADSLPSTAAYWRQPKRPTDPRWEPQIADWSDGTAVQVTRPLDQLWQTWEQTGICSHLFPPRFCLFPLVSY
jgi:hypothetical protein